MEINTKSVFTSFLEGDIIIIQILKNWDDYMSDEINKLIGMVSELKENIDKRFNKVDERLNDIEIAIKELNTTQVKILNSIELIEKDVERNSIHIERLEQKDNFM